MVFLSHLTDLLENGIGLMYIYIGCKSIGKVKSPLDSLGLNVGGGEVIKFVRSMVGISLSAYACGRQGSRAKYFAYTPILGAYPNPIFGYERVRRNGDF